MHKYANITSHNRGGVAEKAAESTGMLDKVADFLEQSIPWIKRAPTVGPILERIIKAMGGVRD